MILLWWSVAAH